MVINEAVISYEEFALHGLGRSLDQAKIEAVG